jgi:hypothetical protein
MGFNKLILKCPIFWREEIEGINQWSRRIRLQKSSREKVLVIPFE